MTTADQVKLLFINVTTDHKNILKLSICYVLHKVLLHLLMPVKSNSYFLTVLRKQTLGKLFELNVNDNLF
jgi:hypothetical protein